MTARIGRIIFVVLVALSVATLPAAAGFAAVATAAPEMSASATMADCDHHHHNLPSPKPQKTAHDGACMAACALNCFTFTGVSVSGIAFSSPVSAVLKPVRMNCNISSLMGSPPFRPPRS